MELGNIDIMLITMLDFEEYIDINRLSKKFILDKPTLYVSLKKLIEYNLVTATNDKPRKYTLNKIELRKWTEEK